MENKTLLKEEIQDKICQLIYRAETFLKWSMKLFNLYEEEKNKFSDPIENNSFFGNSIIRHITLHQVLYFQEAIIILRTLFEQKNKPQEISFAFYFNEIGISDLENKFTEIKNEYCSTGLSKMRDKLFAHKDVKNAGDPFTSFLNPIKKEHIKSAILIVKKLRLFASENFDCPCNNFFEDFYGVVFDDVYSIFEMILDSSPTARNDKKDG